MPVSAPDMPGITLATHRAALHQVAAPRDASIGLPAMGRAAPFAGGTALCFAPGVAMVVGGARPGEGRVADQSGGFVLLRLAGPAAAEVLARGCRLDLHEAAFPPGSVARTPIAQVAVILHRATPTTFELLVPATLAHSFTQFLTTAAAPFGCAVLPDERG